MTSARRLGFLLRAARRLVAFRHRPLGAEDLAPPVASPRPRRGSGAWLLSGAGNATGLSHRLFVEISGNFMKY